MMKSIFMLAAGAATFVTVAVTEAQTTQPTAPETDIPVLQEQAVAAGIEHSYRGPWEYFVGGGAASFDCNGDRFPDLMLAGGTGETQLFVNRSSEADGLRFEPGKLDVSKSDLQNVTGLYPVDIDNDGHRDVVLLRVGRNVILKGGPDCSFKSANREFAFDGGRAWTTAFAATFEKDTPFPTLAFGNYVDRSAPGSPWGTCHDNVFLRPAKGDRPNYAEAEQLTPGYCALSMIFTDWNRSGTPSLRITNDRHYYRDGEEQMWRVDPGKAPRLYRRADGWKRVNIWGMGIAEGDIDADGYPEYALTSMGDTKLQTLDAEAEEGRPVYRDIAFERKATAHRPYTGSDLKPSTGWHSEFADFNNDGLLDLFIAKGNVEKMPDFADFDPDNLLLGQHDGTFFEAGHISGIDLDRRGRGAVIADFDLDGNLDLIVVNREAPVSVFRNRGGKTDWGTRPMGNWLQIELQQDGANTNAVGATILVKSGNETRLRKIQSGGGHASGHSGFIHVGTGVAERAQIRVKWPDGEWSPAFRVFANNFVIIRRGESDARYWYP
ncbi:FG-GAP repeat domain-containing protein [Hoeflea sp. TYP-13]|uniref:FG-GAP repeat domain-containing protein n=1 Tax=Hoeflea sp. TYP-13 TaxID=3230023 RepID=UPI0034C69BF6